MDAALRKFAIDFGDKSTLNPGCNTPKHFTFYGPNAVRKEVLFSSLRGDSKRSSSKTYILTHVHHCQCEEHANNIRKHAFMSICLSFGWLAATLLRMWTRH